MEKKGNGSFQQGKVFSLIVALVVINQPTNQPANQQAGKASERTEKNNCYQSISS